MKNIVINRDAGDKLAGSRLQKLRVVELMLDAIEKSPEYAHIYCAIEYGEDVFIRHNTSDGSTTMLEQDKNFSKDSRFTLNNLQILNSLVGFLDSWINRNSSPNVFFCFYTPREIGKESETDFYKINNLTLPAEPILRLLQEKQFQNAMLLTIIKTRIINEYESQYTNRPGEGHLEAIKKFTDSDWVSFFSHITWMFGEENETELKATILKKIKQSKCFTHSLNGKEMLIVSRILELIESRQNVKEITERFVFASDLKNVFLEVDSGVVKKAQDPLHEMWDRLPKPADKRNLHDKIKAVCRIYDDSKLGILSRRVSHSLIEKQEFETDKSFQSLRYRIFDACQRELMSIMKSKQEGQSYSEKEIDETINAIHKIAIGTIEKLSNDYNYSIRNSESIEGIILELFDSCFLAFDQVYE